VRVGVVLGSDEERRGGGCGIAIEPVRRSEMDRVLQFLSFTQAAGRAHAVQLFWLSVGDVGVDPPFLSESLSRLDPVRLRLC
jgi:hypothetical protein